MEELFAERKEMKGALKKLNWDIQNMFILRAEEYYADILEIYTEFSFDVLICDNAFTAIPFVTDKMQIPVVAIGVLPLTETSKDLPPAGLGMTPSKNFSRYCLKNRTSCYFILWISMAWNTIIILCLI
jgi:hypothetical protein